MAQEIRASATLTITRDGFTITGNTSQIANMTGSNYAGAVLTVSSSYMEIPTGSCQSIRYLFVSNESTASIDLAVNSASQSFTTLREGDVAMLPPPETQGTYWMKANSGSADVQVVIVEI